MRAYLIVGALGAALFCGYWGVISKAIPRSTARQQDAKPAETKPEEKKPSGPEAEKKKKREDHKIVVQHGQSNVNIEQHTEGENSPIVNSPITVNPPVNPYAPVHTYDFNGAQRTSQPGRESVVVGEEFNVFQKILELQRAKDWTGLRESCEGQIKRTPAWLTPYLFAGVAYLNLGERTKGIERLTYVREQAHGNPAYAEADRLLEDVKAQLPKN